MPADDDHRGRARRPLRPGRGRARRNAGLGPGRGSSPLSRRHAWPVSRLGWIWAQVTRRLWFRVGVFGLAAVASALVAAWAAPFVPKQLTDRVREGSAQQILSILASSMLLAATFALGTMVQAFAAAAQVATPRATAVLIDDPFSQNVLSTFLGAFVFSIVALIGHSVSYYGPGGEVVLMAATALVVVVVITAFFGWLDHLVGLTRLGETIRKIERRAADALAATAREPHLGGVPPDADPLGRPVPASETGYVNHLDLSALQAVAEGTGGRILVAALPGKLVDPGTALAKTDWQVSEEEARSIRDAFPLMPERTFEQDPRFCLAVLTEIASRALSPGINDPGTAIGVIATQQRLLTDWARAERSGEAARYAAVAVPELPTLDLMEDAFGPLVRDTAGIVEAGLRLQKALAALAAADPDRFGRVACEFSERALAHAEKSLALPEDRARLAAAAPAGAARA
ncbi:MAG: DUF2254 family protein [Amaricoccus sp.]